MKIRMLAAATIATVTLISGVANADQLDDIKKKGELVVGVLGTDEPLSFIDPKTRELVGYDDFAQVKRVVAAFVARPAVARGLAIPAAPT